MARSARQARQVKEPVRKPSPLQEGAAAVGGMISRNPVLVGGSTAFMVSLFYVSANALWYQPHAHTSAFFATREFSWPADRDAPGRGEPETTIQIERPAEAAAPIVRPKSDPVVEQVQGVLKTLNFYDGTVDGLSGPATSRAIEAYQQKMGLNATGQIDDQLLNQLGLKSPAAAIQPVPAPQPRPAQSQAKPAAVAQPEPAQQPSAPAISQRIAKIQEGLRAFGNNDIGVDGVAGARTKSAIKEFQSLFGLPQTGEPDEAVYAKMKAIGLTH
ncbi:peptidoglycan-binding domain-containing protein [Pseudaminobacter soli (ex Li et al. 2025)]|uniref:Peptidoglycan-binding protein n=1 Tax=Pseudaminobacter soli (ex Li et al. 2025) TaxID=1295366 RepID=A0A2P7SFT2_9HYPH|nr:peptidoglycan-binding protein [Mesorhizobium soli]PSJ61356.1 peptidoglycan-binding protein [Mesorhizobium soli]